MTIVYRQRNVCDVVYWDDTALGDRAKNVCGEWLNFVDQQSEWHHFHEMTEQGHRRDRKLLVHYCHPTLSCSTCFRSVRFDSNRSTNQADQPIGRPQDKVENKVNFAHDCQSLQQGRDVGSQIRTSPMPSLMGWVFLRCHDHHLITIRTVVGSFHDDLQFVAIDALLLWCLVCITKTRSMSRRCCCECWRLTIAISGREVPSTRYHHGPSDEKEVIGHVWQRR